MEWFIFDDLFGINQIYVERFFGERLHFAVKDGDIDEVEELLAEPGATINTCYYGENLLWTAIMNNQEEMAVFLIDNGIDTTFKCCRIELNENEENLPTAKDNDKKSQAKVSVRTSKSIANGKGILSEKNNASENDCEITAVADVFVVTCRQLAYEKEQFDIVNLIDFKQGCLLRWLKPPSHTVRLIKSAKPVESESLKNIILPPSKKKSPSASSVRSRKYKQRKQTHSVTNPSTPAAQDTSVQEVELPAILSGAVISSPTQSQAGSICPPESYKGEGIEEPSDTNRVRAALHTATPNRARMLLNSTRISLNKTAVIRQREVNALLAENSQYHLRHPENSNTVVAKLPVRPGQSTHFERRMARSMQCIIPPPRPTSKVNYSSYGNHLPFRRNPLISNAYIDQVFKRSLHCYQHSTRQRTQTKFVGTI